MQTQAAIFVQFPEIFVQFPAASVWFPAVIVWFSVGPRGGSVAPGVSLCSSPGVSVQSPAQGFCIIFVSNWRFDVIGGEN